MLSCRSALSCILCIKGASMQLLIVIILLLFLFFSSSVSSRTLVGYKHRPLMPSPLNHQSKAADVPGGLLSWIFYAESDASACVHNDLQGRCEHMQMHHFQRVFTRTCEGLVVTKGSAALIGRVPGGRRRRLAVLRGPGPGSAANRRRVQGSILLVPN